MINHTSKILFEYTSSAVASAITYYTITKCINNIQNYDKKLFNKELYYKN